MPVKTTLKLKLKLQYLIISHTHTILYKITDQSSGLVAVASGM